MNTRAFSQSWLDTTLYPFKRNYLRLEVGDLHYVDEGQGEVILFVHGTPTWSFLYRDFIKELSKNYRCIAVDHIGFGLSDKPMNYSGTPQEHAKNLDALINHLGLQSITLIVHDFGGPIGLSYAISNPENVERIVMFNTWLWGTKDDPDAQKIDRILHSRLGNFLYLHTNFSPRILIKKAFYDKKKLTQSVHRQYRKPFPNKNTRYGLLKIGQSLIGSSDWYQKQWEQLEKIQDKPFLILWGEQDDFIKMSNVEKWQTKLSNSTLFILKAGHFVQEECLGESLEHVKDWLGE